MDQIDFTFQRMFFLVMFEEVQVSSEGLGIAFAIGNSTKILTLFMLIAMMAVKIVFAAAPRRATWLRTGKLTSLLCDMAAEMELARSFSSWTHYITLGRPLIGVASGKGRSRYRHCCLQERAACYDAHADPWAQEL